jgi:hypothetical protein
MDKWKFMKIFPALKKQNNIVPTFSKIAIFGQFKSGTTACFLKIRDSLNIQPRELFEEPEYIPETKDKLKPVLAKVIIPPNPFVYASDNYLKYPIEYFIEKAELGLKSFENFDKKILLIRDPRDWLVSGMLFLPQENKEIYRDDEATGKILELIRKKELSPKSVTLLEIFDKILPSTDQTVEETITKIIFEKHNYIFSFEKGLNNYFRWNYEDMIDNKNKAVERYLGFKLIKDAIPDERFAHVPRTRSYGNWRDWFTPKDVVFFKPLMSEFINRYKYNQEWKLNSSPQINPEHASKYIKRTIQRKRELEPNNPIAK